MHKQSLYIVTISFFFVAGFLPFHVQAQDEPILKISPYRPASFADLAEKLLPSVVNISSIHKSVQTRDFPEMPHFPPGSPFEDFFENFMDERGRGLNFTPPASLGSGFVIDAENGYIVTNNHVIQDADEVRVTFHDDETLTADVIGRDEKTDIAVLQVQSEKDIISTVPGNSDDLRVGDWILAIGNPFGLGGSVTAGIISAQQRNINAGPYDDFIQTDASINRGNSGGPMFNTKGEVIGINTAIYSPSGGSVGIGFAIPMNMALPVIHQIIEFGHTRRGWLGVRIQTVTDEIADSLGMDNAHGALIASLIDDSPAQKAGLKVGDIITSFDEKNIDEIRDLTRIVAETDIDKNVEIVFWRNGTRMTTSTQIGELEKAEESGLIKQGSATPRATDEMEIEDFGLTLSAIPNSEPTGDEKRVVITKVTPGSEAEAKGLQKGDIIVEINQQAITTPQDADTILKRAKKAQRNSVLLLIKRNNDVQFVALRLNRED